MIAVPHVGLLQARMLPLRSLEKNPRPLPEVKHGLSTIEPLIRASLCVAQFFTRTWTGLGLQAPENTGCRTSEGSSSAEIRKQV